MGFASIFSIIETDHLSNTLFSGFALLLSVFIGSSALYNVFFHPLRGFPGPRWWAASRIPYTIVFFGGKSRHRILQLHEQYGEVVRIAPDQLSFSSPESWSAVHGVPTRGRENPKEPLFHKDLKDSIIGAYEAGDHARMRQILSPGFQPKALEAQEPLLQNHVELLMRRLRYEMAKGDKIDIVQCLSSFSFDVIGDLTFGESFEGLADVSGSYHPWVALLMEALSLGARVDALLRIPVVTFLLQAYLSRAHQDRLVQHRAFTQEKIKRRMALQIPRHDLAEAMTTNGGENKLSDDEIQANAEALIMAGSETVASTLSGALFLLGTHPRILAAVVHEIRSAFASPCDIDFRHTKALRYLQAIVMESMRVYPPVPGAFPRVSPPAGASILGKFVPGGALLSIGHWPVYHHKSNFDRPNYFIPDRWLDNPQFSSDRKSAFQPFGYGPRSCLGKSLANMEISLVLTRMLFEFDIQVTKESSSWLDQDAYAFWQRPPLLMHFTPRVTG